MPSFVNYYETLQVQPSAETAVIEAAAKALIDTGDYPARKIKTALDHLSDDAKRAAHDKEIRAQLENKIGSYKLLDTIAEGGFGRAYKAKHLLLDELVCIKHNLNVSKRDTDLIIKEAKSIWDLRHYALPVMRDLIVLPDGSCCLVMSYIEGPTLMQVVENHQAKKKDLDPENACWIMSRILDALRYLHLNGVVHGDVKPQNVIVQPDKHAAVLVDFGLASVKPTRGARPDGYTPLFAAPESQSEKPPLPETDLFCLGLTMIYALGGDPRTRRIPMNIPTPIRDYLDQLVQEDVYRRPNWEKANLLQDLNEARQEAFGRMHTGNKKLDA